jgi:hypothetical protein
LNRVAEFSEDNKMTVNNLAVVFGPPILNGAKQTLASRQIDIPPPKLKAAAFIQNIQNSINGSTEKSSHIHEATEDNNPEAAMKNLLVSISLKMTFGAVCITCIFFRLLKI